MRWPFSRPDESTVVRAATVPRELYDDLMAKYHALVGTITGMAERASAPAAPAAPGFVVPLSPSDALGPLTKAALAEMSRGMSHASRRAQMEATIALAGTLNDEQLADRVRKGERPRMISIG